MDKKTKDISYTIEIILKGCYAARKIIFKNIFLMMGKYL